MSSRPSTYEVVVLVKDDPEKVAPHYNSFHGLHRSWEKHGMKYIVANSPKQAAKKARKYGKIWSVRKHHATTRYEQFDKFILDQDPNARIDKPDVKVSAAIAMDEMIWRKRNVRRNNMCRDKNKV